MTEEREKFIVEMLQSMRRDMAQMKSDMVNLGLRQSASEHFEHGMMAHVASLHASIDEMKADMRQVKTRLELAD
jgi:hypothetical protein